MKDETEEINLILDLLKSNSEGLIIKDIACELNLNRDTIARHLRVLLMKGDVEAKQIGPAKIYYITRRIPVSVLKNFCQYPQVYFNKFLQIIEINKEFRQMAGAYPEIIVGKKYDELEIPLLTDEALKTNYKYALKGRKIVKYVSANLNGADYYLRAVLLPVVLENGRTGLCLVLIDKTESFNEVSSFKKSEDFYRAIVEDQTEYICLALPDGIVTFVNSAYCTMRNRTPKELIGHKSLPLNLGKIIQEESAGIDAENTVKTSEIQVIMPDGEVSWQQWKIRGMFDNRGVLTGYLLAGRDFTELKRAEEQIRMYHSNLEILVKERTNELQMINRQLIEEISERKETEERLNLAIEGSKYSFWDWDLITDKIVFSRRLKMMLGLLNEDIGDDIDVWRSRIHPDDIDSVIQAQKDHFDGLKDFYEAEYRMRHKDGYYVWMYAIGRVSSRKTDGTPIRMSGLQADISSNIQMKKDFELQKEMIGSLVHVSVLKQAVDICLKNAIKYTDLSSACFYLFDTKRENIRLFSMTENLGANKKKLEDFSVVFEPALKNAENKYYYIGLKESDSEFYRDDLFRLLGSYAVIPVTHKGNLLGIFCFFSKEFEDIPENIRITLESAAKSVQDTLMRIKNDEEITKTQSHLSIVLSNSGMAIWEIDLTNGMVTFNYADNISKGDPGSIRLKTVSVPWKGSIHPDDYENAVNAMNDHISGKLPFYSSTHRVVSKSGKVRYYKNTGRIDARDDAGNPVRISGVSVNISGKKDFGLKEA